MVGVARRAGALQQWQAETGDQAAFVVADLAEQNALAQVVIDVAAPFGPPDIVVHAAGINTRQVADDVTPEGWDITLTLNLSVPFFLSQALVPAMKQNGWGRIVNSASLQASRAFPAGIAYGASKAGLAS